MLVEPDADADLTVPTPLRHPQRLGLAERLPFEIRQVEVLEHDVDQLFEGDVGLVVVDAGPVAGLVVALALLAAGLPDDLSGLRFAVALTDARRVVAVDEAILADAADRDLDHPIATFPDDRFLRDDVRDV